MITETTREIEFPCTPWVVDNVSKSIQPQKGTWTLAPVELQRHCHGILSCSNCGAVMPLKPLPTDEIDRKHQTGTLIRKDVRCNCGLLFTAKLVDWDKRRLYCIAYEVYDSPNPKSKRIEKEYLHAESREQAIWAFSQGHVSDVYKLIDAGPVFGYFADNNDKDGNRLSVD